MCRVKLLIVNTHRKYSLWTYVITDDGEWWSQTLNHHYTGSLPKPLANMLGPVAYYTLINTIAFTYRLHIGAGLPRISVEESIVVIS